MVRFTRFHALLAALALAPVHGSNSSLDYRIFSTILGRSLEANDASSAFYLMAHGDKVEVPITEEVLSQFRAAFTHAHEVAFLLFANKDGVIDYAVQPSQIPVTGENSAVGVFFDPEYISEVESTGRIFVGEYHHHRRNPSEIRDTAAKQHEFVERTHRVAPYLTVYEYDNTAPSRGDLAGIIDPSVCEHSPEACQEGKDMLARIKVNLIGGLDTHTFTYEVRAFSYVHTGERALIVPSSTAWSKVIDSCLETRGDCRYVEHTIVPQ